MRGPSGLAPLRSHDFPNRYPATLGAKFIMPFSRSQSATDMARFKFSRRELPGKLLTICAALLLPERRSEVLVTPTEVQPKFKIGDLVAQDWVDEDDLAATDFGQVFGMCYFPEAQSCFPAKSWVYYINWTSSTTCDINSISFPCYDGEGTRESDLRLVREVVCKH
jgi:hypothetical protein